MVCCVFKNQLYSSYTFCLWSSLGYGSFVWHDGITISHLLKVINWCFAKTCCPHNPL